jgi:hypothetical protein
VRFPLLALAGRGGEEGTLVTLVFKSSSYNSYIKKHFSLEYTIEGSIIFIKYVVKWLDNGFQLSTLLYRLASTLYSHNEEGLTDPNLKVASRPTPVTSSEQCSPPKSLIDVPSNLDCLKEPTNRWQDLNNNNPRKAP